MTTYKDHPLAFLSSVSPEGLRLRADTWRTKKLAVPGLDVVAALEAAAATLERKRNALMTMAEESRDPEGEWVFGDVGQTGVAALVHDANSEIADPARLRAYGQRLRVGNADPHGGSTASHLEHAADEIERLDKCLERAIDLAAIGQSWDAVRAEVQNGLGQPVKAPTHEAPVVRM